MATTSAQFMTITLTVTLKAQREYWGNTCGQGNFEIEIPVAGLAAVDFSKLLTAVMPNVKAQAEAEYAKKEAEKLAAEMAERVNAQVEASL